MNSFLLKKGTPALALLGLALAGCQPEIDAPGIDKGSADFTKYVAVGNSLTAGFSDGGLYREGQLNSYPSILASQFKAAGGGDFTQPLFSEAQLNGSGYLRLTGFTATGSPVTASVTDKTAITGGVQTRAGVQFTYAKYLDPINNLGVPGIRMSDIETPNFGNTALNGGTLLAPTPIFNSYFERITPNGSNQTYRQRVAASAPTFFTFWLGNNDVLGYATAGAAASSLTSVDDFTRLANGILDDLTANGAKGVVATIPDVTNVPFFTTVGPSFRAVLPAGASVVVTTGPAFTGTALTRKVIARDDIRDAAGSGKQLFTLTASPYVALYGRTNNGKAWRDVYNQAKPSLPPTIDLRTFLLLSGIDTTKAFGASNENPMPSTIVLDDLEQPGILARTTAFNDALKSKANAKNLAIFDANAFFRGIAANGFSINGTNNSAGFISGNLFSLDGVHPTPRGYAVIANEMIKVINTKYGSTLQTVNPNAYRAIIFP
ncbi:G-D-S-L family lipolytic protein [Hymenobacter aquaticus]|uniref:G-D-S-L family lipolytic protein n=1 Tax=Hymenobacter aquaticus TaxID=1867101 RepID=A0A4Z0PRX2_9BACT|nr:SGNH/GDSL hydrolase family protein [Hymenobacter aquaticus]TGE20480.1 G-D-S-L family lipolytic protein [Hymenobacter aquaticus]